VVEDFPPVFQFCFEIVGIGAKDFDIEFAQIVLEHISKHFHFFRTQLDIWHKNLLAVLNVRWPVGSSGAISLALP